jgi:hypothetical protein
MIHGLRVLLAVVWCVAAFLAFCVASPRRPPGAALAPPTHATRPNPARYRAGGRSHAAPLARFPAHLPEPSANSAHAKERRRSIIAQPGDGDCLFHSLRVGGRLPGSAASLRATIADFALRNGGVDFGGLPLRDWIFHECGVSVARYAQAMRSGKWGGAIEIAIFCAIFHRQVHVFRRGNLHTPVLQVGSGGHVLRVLWSGAHYDALSPV